MNELILPDHQILVKEGEFELIGYEKLKTQIDELGRHLISVEVTSDNIKENKQLVAQVRKLTDQLNKERIEFKKQYLRPVNNLEQQVKELTNAVKDYEAVVRKQIREIEEQERDQKEQEIHSLFDLRIRAYGSPELFPFSDFLSPKHLNKSTSIKKVEEDMVQWFENRNKEIQALKDFADNIKHDKADVFNHYLLSNDFTETVSYFTNLKAREKELNETIEKIPNKTRKNVNHKDKFVYFKINEKDKEKVGSLLTLSNVKYEIA